MRKAKRPSRSRDCSTIYSKISKDFIQENGNEKVTVEAKSSKKTVFVIFLKGQ